MISKKAVMTKSVVFHPHTFLQRLRKTTQSQLGKLHLTASFKKTSLLQCCSVPELAFYQGHAYQKLKIHSKSTTQYRA
jgi:hypothetical protein